MRLKAFFVLSILSMAIVSCKVNSSIKQPYTSYFIDNNISLYFIKPLELTNNEIGASIDFTFKDSSLNSDSGVTCNFTLYNYSYQKNDEFYFVENATRTRVQSPAVIFMEIKQNKPVVRITSLLSPKILLSALDKKEFQFIVKSSSLNKEFTCLLSSRAMKKWNKTHNDVLPTLNMRKGQ